MIHSCSMIFFFIFFYCRSMYFIWTILWLWGQEEHKRDTGHTGLFLYWAVFGCSCCIRDWTALLVPFFGLFQIALINFCTACTQTAFVIQKLKALGDFQIIFPIIFASFVPDLTWCWMLCLLVSVFSSVFGCYARNPARSGRYYVQWSGRTMVWM